MGSALILECGAGNEKALILAEQRHGEQIAEVRQEMSASAIPANYWRLDPLPRDKIDLNAATFEERT